MTVEHRPSSRTMSAPTASTLDDDPIPEMGGADLLITVDNEGEPSHAQNFPALSTALFATINPAKRQTDRIHRRLALSFYRWADRRDQGVLR